MLPLNNSSLLVKPASKEIMESLVDVITASLSVPGKVLRQVDFLPLLLNYSLDYPPESPKPSKKKKSKNFSLGRVKTSDYCLFSLRVHNK